MNGNPLAQSLDRGGLEAWIHAAHMSGAAYDPASWNFKMGAAGWPESGYLSGSFSFGAGWAYSGAEHGILEISCAGTKGIRDLSSDALSWIPNWWKRLPAGWWVGYGMVRGPRAAWPELMWIIQSTGVRPVKEVRWFGHSKGGGEAELCHAACLVHAKRLDAEGKRFAPVSSCIAIETPRVFKPFARDQYRYLLNTPGRTRCDIIINTSDGRRDAVTAWPRTLQHGGDLNVLGAKRVYSGDDALEKWKEIKRLEHRGRGPIKGRYDAHGLRGVTEHMEELLEIQRPHTGGVELTP